MVATTDRFPAIVATTGLALKSRSPYRLHPDSYPPTILHVTDGESTDGDPQDIADALRKLHTSDGEALLFNLHVSTHGAHEIVFAQDDSGLVDDYSKMLFRMSSPLPAHLAKLEHFQIESA